MSSNNPNQEERYPFWNRTLIGIPFWLLALALAALILYWAYKQEAFSQLGFTPTPRSGSMSFSQKGLLDAPTISPVETRMGLPTNMYTY